MVRTSTPTSAASAAAVKRASISALSSTPTSCRAGGTRQRLAAPAPTPTSRTEAPAGSASTARRLDGVEDGTSWASNSAGGKPHGDSGAALRMSSGIAQAWSAAAHLELAVVIGLRLGRGTTTGCWLSLTLAERL